MGNNPINFYDPYGLAIGDWWDARTWFNSGFTESWSDQANSIGKTWGDVLAGNWDDIENENGSVLSIDTTVSTATVEAVWRENYEWNMRVRFIM